MLLLVGCSDNDNNNVNGDANSEQTAIKIGLDPYDYATVPAYLSKEILEQEGFEVDITEAQVGILYEALANKEIDAFIDVWRPNLHESYLDKYDDQFETAGTLFSDMPLGIAVPTYMEDINTIEDLTDSADLFDGELYAIEPGSGMAQTTEKMVETYDMTGFTIKNSTTAAMLSQVEQATKNEEPIAFNAWRPHPMFVRYDIKFLEDPRQSWKLDDVEIGVTPELKDDAPTAYTLFSNMSLSLDMVEKWLISIDEGSTPEELAAEWVEDNQDTVDQWLEK
ncbi:glycine betaine ABC transporter substrate-binding protein [Lentibacillus saliphilus]|uniref:glycine betaine ABC transporter substrate-binding protein n=1 Tax=Lentibacillus saliphilus TaxID=2737028 RepID=UPI001C2F5817|nr:glycine betaine ABC transporter substrate-binding protein [Lentibacillus saliphilus]